MYIDRHSLAYVCVCTLHTYMKIYILVSIWADNMSVCVCMYAYEYAFMHICMYVGRHVYVLHRGGLQTIKSFVHAQGIYLQMTVNYQLNFLYLY